MAVKFMHKLTLNPKQQIIKPLPGAMEVLQSDSVAQGQVSLWHRASSVEELDRAMRQLKGTPHKEGAALSVLDLWFPSVYEVGAGSGAHVP